MLIMLEKEGRKFPFKISSIHPLHNPLKKNNLLKGEGKGIQNQVCILYCIKVIITIDFVSYFLCFGKSETIVSL